MEIVKIQKKYKKKENSKNGAITGNEKWEAWQ